MCMPEALGGGGNFLQTIGMGVLAKPFAKPFMAHNGLDGVNKVIYGGSGKSKAPSPATNPLAVGPDPNQLATPLGKKVGTGYTNEGYNGLQI